MTKHGNPLGKKPTAARCRPNECCGRYLRSWHYQADQCDSWRSFAGCSTIRAYKTKIAPSTAIVRFRRQTSLYLMLIIRNPIYLLPLYHDVMIRKNLRIDPRPYVGLVYKSLPVKIG